MKKSLLRMDKKMIKAWLAVSPGKFIKPKDEKDIISLSCDGIMISRKIRNKYGCRKKFPSLEGTQTFI